MGGCVSKNAVDEYDRSSSSSSNRRDPPPRAKRKPERSAPPSSQQRGKSSERRKNDETSRRFSEGSAFSMSEWDAQPGRSNHINNHNAAAPPAGGKDQKKSRQQSVFAPPGSSQPLASAKNVLGHESNSDYESIDNSDSEDENLYNNRTVARQGGNKPLTNAEVRRRIDASPSGLTAQINGASVRYAYLSQRGYYPDDVNKANQDAYCVDPKYNGVAGDSFMAVFDGHGKFGDGCSLYAKRHLPILITKFMKQSRNKSNKTSRNKGPMKLDRNQMEAACHKALVECNRKMHADHSIDDSLSGTTCIAALFHNNLLTVCNVGDSRAVVGRRDKRSRPGEYGADSYKAIPLSRDQTPFRKDERERVKKCGARIMSLDQLEGLEPIHENWGDLVLGETIDEEGDPPRIWSPSGDYPGTAFTRSLGDVIADDIGVFAEPEMVTLELTAEDRIIVLASDGVFEFLTNQSVIDICAKYDNPIEACRAVVAESYELWLEYELRTDDISIICMFLDVPGQVTAVSSGKASRPRTANNPNIVPSDSDSKPPRRRVTDEKAKAVEAMAKATKIEFNNEAHVDIESIATEKKTSETQLIRKALKSSAVFSDIIEKQIDLICRVMQPIYVKRGDWVIKQGDMGDHFYVVDEGSFEVRLINKGEEDEVGNGGTLVDVLKGSRDSAPPCFGELALMYSSPRTASVIAQTDGLLWGLHRYAFKKILAEVSNRRVYFYKLRQIKSLRCLSSALLWKLVDSMKEVKYGEGTSMMKKGKHAKSLYIIEEGKCERVNTNTKSATIIKHDVFGERCILIEGAEEADIVVGNGGATFMTLSKDVIDETIVNLHLLAKGHDRASRSRRPSPSMSEIDRHGILNCASNYGTTIVATGGNSVYTLRIMLKKVIADGEDYEKVMKEVAFLKEVSESNAVSTCPCIPFLKSTFVDKHSLYLLYDEAVGCSLKDLMTESADIVRCEEVAKFAAMCCIIALEVMHEQGIMYRGIAPDSLLVGRDGFLLLNDFSISKMKARGNFTICGNVQYQAPEMINRNGHGLPVDFWALGILIYELLWGKTPFSATSAEAVSSNILRYRKADLELPSFVSPQCRKICKNLLTPSPTTRLGAYGIYSIKDDPWFNSRDWNSMKSPELIRLAQRKLSTALDEPDVTVQLTKNNKFRGNDNIWEKF